MKFSLKKSAKLYFFIVLLIQNNFIYGDEKTTNKTLIAEKCPDLNCVRNNIDKINVEIVKLLSLRMNYVYEAGDLKYKNKKSSATDEERANAVLEQVEKISEEYKLPPEYVRKIFTIIVNDSTSIEQKYIDKKTKN